MQYLWSSCVLVLALCLFGLRGPSKQAGDFEWRTDLAQARVEAAQSGQPLLVVFR